jgi:LacI family transcriptional regulator
MRIPQLARLCLDCAGGPCFFAVNDVMALGAMTALREAGLDVPRDAQVAGFDDIPTLRDFRPALTTVRLPLELIGERAVQLALAADGETSEPIEGEVLLRDSAG